MLKGLDPMLGPELLGVLAAMGHGDDIVIADANFPAASMARKTAHGRAIRTDCSAIRAIQAVLSVLPVDDFTPDPVRTMQVVGDADAVPEIVAEARPLFGKEGATTIALERFAFYEAATTAYAVLHTGETRLYGNFIIRKGVIHPAG